MDQQPSSSCDQRILASDVDFDTRIQRLLNDDDNLSDVSSEADDSDQDPNYVPSDSDSSNCDYNDSSDDEDIMLEDAVGVVTVDNYLDSQPQVLHGKNGYEWSTVEPPRNRRTPAHNIIRGLSGLTAEAKAVGENPTKKDVWKLIFTDSMIDTIVKETNRKLTELRGRISDHTSKYNYNPCDQVEVRALLGLFLYTSIFKSGHEDMRSLFNKDPTGRPIFLATMSCKRFEILISCLRFDDSTTREQRKAEDKAAAISDLFNQLISNGRGLFCPKANVTVDEMLVPFRGKCRFKQYMPKKPAKYGIKIFCMADSGSSYLCNAFIYTGKNCYSVGLTRDEQQLLKSTQTVIKLTKHIERTNRNVTADNWFTSIELVDQLKLRGLTFVGTIKKKQKRDSSRIFTSQAKTCGIFAVCFPQ
ncbi:piggyBac transposable element-derived protein 4-like [Homalodisca vitripennis]|uniref:piggyBac transposable element-derived protein 4-like n=1 Tax=Homalodisca vitripennis TaxID=197043 RepID=UPI001EEBD1D9|nr:piggyBac transposable element-derived protein 4-like [Homalodisca vitripennis]